MTLPRLARPLVGMARLDRLPWAWGVAADCFGVRFGLRVSDAALVDDAASRLAPGWTPSASSTVARLYSVVAGGDGEGRGFRLYADAQLLAKTADQGGVLDALESELRLHVAQHAPDRVFIRAGVVGWRGRAIVIPGPSRTGKSRLVHALVAEGATYYSDVYAVFDSDGRVHSYPAPLALRDEEGGTGRRIPPAELGRPADVPPLALGLVADTPYVTGQPARLWRASARAGAVAVLAQCVPARERAAEVLAGVKRAVRRARVLRGARGEAAEAAQRVLFREATWLEAPA